MKTVSLYREGDFFSQLNALGFDLFHCKSSEVLVGANSIGLATDYFLIHDYDQAAEEQRDPRLYSKTDKYFSDAFADARAGSPNLKEAGQQIFDDYPILDTSTTICVLHPEKRIGYSSVKLGNAAEDGSLVNGLYRYNFPERVCLFAVALKYIYFVSEAGTKLFRMAEDGSVLTLMEEKLSDS